MIDFNRVLSIVEAFNRESVEYKIFGGVAVNLHGLPRTTDDVDFFVDPAPENVVRIKRALRSIWDDPHLDEIQDDEMIGAYPNFSYEPPDEPFSIDVVSRLGEAFVYTDLEAERIEIQGISVRFVTAETLYRMKRDTVQPIDKIDALRLRKKFDLKE
jgi:predicted nucleotidyltransferase